MLIRVETYSGYQADERPLRFHLGEQTLEVVDVMDRWYSPGATYFRLRASDGAIYVLRHSGNEDSWTLESYRRDE